MLKIKLLLLATLAIFVASVVATRVAQAELNTPELLVDGKKSLKFTAKSGATIIESLGGSVITCTSSSGSGASSSALSGTLEVIFAGCNVAGSPCQSSGAAEGQIVMPLLYELVFDTKPEAGTKLGAGIIFNLLTQIHITCPTIGVLVLVRGSVLGLLKPTNTLVKELELELAQKAGENLEKSFFRLNEKTKTFEEVKSLPAPLESESTISKKFESSGEEAKAGKIIAEKETEFLLMA